MPTFPLAHKQVIMFSLKHSPALLSAHSWVRATLQALLPPQVNKPEGQVSTAIYFTHKETPGGRWTSLLLRSELLTAETAIRKVNCFSEINLHVPASVPCPAIWCGLVLLNPSYYSLQDIPSEGFQDHFSGHDGAAHSSCQEKHEPHTDILPLRNRMHLHIIYAVQYM